MLCPAGLSKAGRVLLVAACAGSAACSTTVPVVDLGPGSPALRRLDDLGARGHVADVTAADSTWRFAGVRVLPSALAVRTFSDSVSVPLESVRSVLFWSPRRGALEGVGIGLLMAGAAGLLAAALTDPPADGSETRADRGLLVGAAVGVFTVPIGFVIGIGGGHRTVFEFPACVECGR